MAKTIHYGEIKSRDFVRNGKKYEGSVTQGAKAEVALKKSIRLFGVRYLGDRCEKTYDITFSMGDTAEYDSYNLIYLGTIVSIGAKTVTIRHDRSKQTTRLSIDQFNAKNWDFDLDRIAASNADTLMHI